MRLEFKKSLYPLEVFMKAAYVFTDQAYIYFDENENYIFVDFEAKKGMDIIEIQGEFKNELLAQMLRKYVSEKTGGIRELILQRALSSSMILSNSNLLEYNNDNERDYDLDAILKDWFEQDENGL